MGRTRTPAEQKVHDLLVGSVDAGASVSRTADELGIDRAKANVWVSRARATAKKSKGKVRRAGKEASSDSVKEALVVIDMAGAETPEELWKLLDTSSLRALLIVLGSALTSASVRSATAFSIQTALERSREAHPGEGASQGEPTKADILAAVKAKLPPEALATILREQGYIVSKPQTQEQ